MKYPVAVFKDLDSCYGVCVPDLPGCNSAGETFDDALNNVKEAILDHVEILMEDGLTVPMSSDIKAYTHDLDFHGAGWEFVDVDVATEHE